MPPAACTRAEDSHDEPATAATSSTTSPATVRANSRMPEAFRHGGRSIGLPTVFDDLPAAVLTVVDRVACRVALRLSELGEPVLQHVVQCDRTVD
jgi:hypothetical protein